MNLLNRYVLKVTTYLRRILTMPMCLSIVKILLLVPGSYSFDVINFSTASTTPSLHLIATAVLGEETQTKNAYRPEITGYHLCIQYFGEKIEI